MRRAAEIVLIVLLAPVVLPAGALIALAILLDSPGPVIYRSRRVGRSGEPFDVLKFRSMACDTRGPAISAAGDPRYTPIGRFLAKSRLDELPQLVNILRGEMAFVGPRPELEEFVAAHRDQYETILRVPPGLTGPAQLVYASEGAMLAAAAETERERVYRDSILPNKVLIDRSYAEKRTALGDVLIVVRTFALPLTQLLAVACRRLPVRDRPYLVAGAGITTTYTLMIGFFGVFLLDGLA